MSVTARTVVRLAAGVLLAAGALVAPQASAAACSTSGITAVVDSNDGAGGGVDTRCDPVSGSRTAAAVFQDTGVTVQRNADGSVCKVNGRPADAQCGRLGTEYWALWWSDGKSGSWVYAQEGDSSLTVPANGSVAWAWQGPSGRRTPATQPPVHQTSRKPTPRTPPAPTRTQTPRPTRSAPAEPAPLPASSTSTAAPATTPARARAVISHRRSSASPRKKAAVRAKGTPGRSASPRASAAATTPEAAVRAATAPASSDQGSEATGLPVWAPALLLVLLTTGAAGTVWWRKKG